MSNSLIVFDSGQGSNRRAIIQSILRHSLLVKGVPMIAISPVDIKMTQAYISLLPPILKQKVYGLASYHIYSQIALKLTEILQVLTHTPSGEVLSHQLYQVSHKMTDKLVQELMRVGFTVILDRSRISSYGYQSCVYNIPGSMDLAQKILDINNKYFFIESPKRMPLQLRAARFYDVIAPELNIKLKNWIRVLNNKTGNVISIIPSQLSLQESVSRVKEVLA